MMKKNLLILFLLTGISCFAQTKKSLPIIDMHLHALSADDQGPSGVIYLGASKYRV